MVGITVYWEKFWKKFRAKQPLSEGQEHEFRRKQPLDEEDSMLFTVKEMMEATQNFSQKIREDAMGKVFFGKLPDIQHPSRHPSPMIIHRDVKTSNILLDSNLNGKLCDFGFSMMTMDRKAPIEADVAGTAGYLDPEYITTRELTQKSDVYGFGVVLFEIMSGRHPIDVSLPEQEINLIRWVKDEVSINENPGKIVEIMDKKMDGKYDMKSMSLAAKVALRCVEERASSRPSISEVVGELKQAFMYEKVLRY